MAVFPKSYAATVQRLRVPAGILLAAAFIWLSQPVLPTLILGLPLALAGLAIRAWAAGHLRKNQQLTVSGPYAFVRNPLYIGSLLTAIGCTIAAAQPYLAACVGGVFLFVYLPVMEQEEQHLANLFPDFAAYAARVPQLLPRIPEVMPAQAFSWDVFRSNKEQKALYGFAVVYLFLIAKSIWP